MTHVDKLLALGDSVVWGQGLAHEDKFASLVFEGLTGEPLPRADIKARSGAIIGSTGVNGDQLDGLIDEAADRPPLTAAAIADRTTRHEVPNAFPTVLQQIEPENRGSEPGVETAEQISDDEATSTDIVILDGGANDIDVLGTAIMPIYVDAGELNIRRNTQAEVEMHARTHFYTGMKQVIAAAREKFPNATLVVTGYFPILTEETDTTEWDYFLAWALLAAGLQLANFPAVAGTKLFVDQAKRNAVHFYRRQLYWLRRAVTESNADPEIRGPGILFAHAGYRKRNGIWAAEPWVFSPDDDDVMKNVRLDGCDAVYDGIGVDHKMCELTASGHPNELGEEAYAENIIDRLETSDSRSLRESLSGLTETTPIRVRSSLERYRLDVSEGLRATLDHTVVDCIRVRVWTGGNSSTNNVYLRIGDGNDRRFLLNRKRAVDGLDSFIEFDSNSVNDYVIDPIYDSDDTTPLRLSDIDEISIEKDGIGGWDFERIQVEINGRRVVDENIGTTLVGDATWEHAYPAPETA